MDNTKITYSLLGFVIGVILTLIFAQIWGYQGFGGMMGSRFNSFNNMMSNSSVQSNIDAHFIEQMIPHHDDAITMANIALRKAEHSEIKQLAQNIIKNQTDENNKMKQWYKDWFGRDVPDTFASLGHGMGSGMMHNGMMGDDNDIQSLETVKPFDKEFIEQMIPHHQMAVMMSQMLVSSTNRTELHDLGELIIIAQNQEIEQMRNWYRSWYNQ